MYHQNEIYTIPYHTIPYHTIQPFVRPRSACLSKVVVFCCPFECTSKGNVERETSLALLEWEGGTFQGSLCSPLKSVGFLWHLECTGKGYVERETSLALLEWEGGTFQGLHCSPLKSGGFGGTFVCTGKGDVKRELLLLRSRERRALYRARFAHLSKLVVFLALLCAAVRGM